LVEVVQVLAPLVLLPVSAASVVVGVTVSAGLVALVVVVVVVLPGELLLVVVEPVVVEVATEVLVLVRALFMPAPPAQAVENMSAKAPTRERDFNIHPPAGERVAEGNETLWRDGV
jgi:hypothetical protein